jgi:uncharacterized membrane protein
MYIKSFFAVIASFLVIDGLWIGFVAKGIYQRELGDWVRSDPNLLATGVFYIAYATGIVYLAVRPGLNTGSVTTTLISGAALGALAYGSFTITNYAILTRWSKLLLVSDIAWGVVLTSVCAGIGFAAARASW